MKLNQQQKFNDTTEVFSYRYNDKENLCDIEFEHYKDGVFMAEGYPIVDSVDFCRQLSKYGDIIVIVKLQNTEQLLIEKGEKIQITFAMSKNWCNLDMDTSRMTYTEELQYILEQFNGWTEATTGSPIDDDELETLDVIISDRLISKHTNDIQTAFRPVNMDNGKPGEKKRINVNGHIGVLIEPYIYYIGGNMKYSYNCNASKLYFDKRIKISGTDESAFVGYKTDSGLYEAAWIACGREAVIRLHAMYQDMDNSELKFVGKTPEDFEREDKERELKEKEEAIIQEEEAKLKLNISSIYELADQLDSIAITEQSNLASLARKLESTNQIRKINNEYDDEEEINNNISDTKDIGKVDIEIKEESNDVDDESESNLKSLDIPETATEPVEGLGFDNYKLSYKTILGDSKEDIMCLKLYIDSNKMAYMTYTMDVKEVDIDTLYQIKVTKNIRLNCGYTYPVTFTLLDNFDEALADIIKPEHLESIKRLLEKRHKGSYNNMYTSSR